VRAPDREADVRIVHEFYGTPQTTGTGRHYNVKITEPPPDFPGFSVDLMAADVVKGREGDALYLEGDGKAIKALLEELLSLVVDVEKTARENWAKERKKISKCRSCKKWTRYEHPCAAFKKVR
jgi:hypothetical protein